MAILKVLDATMVQHTLRRFIDKFLFLLNCDSNKCSSKLIICMDGYDVEGYLLKQYERLNLGGG